jgi:hypothetical protein
MKKVILLVLLLIGIGTFDSNAQVKFTNAYGLDIYFVAYNNMQQIAISFNKYGQYEYLILQDVTKQYCTYTCAYNADVVYVALDMTSLILTNSFSNISYVFFFNN